MRLKLETRIPEEQPPTDNTRLAEWLTRMMILINSTLAGIVDTLTNDTRILHHLDFVAFSEIDQEPAGLDTPLQVVFGPAQAAQFIELAADGSITFSNPTIRSFTIEIRLSVGRKGNPQTAFLYVYVSLNGIIHPYPTMVSLFNDDEYKPIHLTTISNYNEGDTLRFFIVRDSQGKNDGGLYTFDPALAGIESTHSAKISISHNELHVS